MKYRLKSGVEVDLHDEDIAAISKMNKGEFDFQKLQHYFKDMHDKAHMNLQMISEDTIQSEKDMKKSLSKVIKYGSEEQIADYIIEAIECKVSYMLLQSMK